MNQATANPSPTYELYASIEAAYGHFNERLFGGQLPPCLVVLQRQPKMMGYVSHQRWINDHKRYVDELAINPEYWLGHSLMEVLQTLVHEQCHVWQNYYGQPSRRSYHNREWANKMVEIGLMPSTTGQPGGKQTGEHMNDYPLKDGAFLIAAAELASSGYCLPWLDRTPPVKTHQAIIYDSQGGKVNIAPNSKEAALTGSIGAAILSSSEIHEAANGPGKPPIEPVVLEMVAKKPSRVKYRCGGCGNQVWGRPGMNLACCDCDLAFSETSAS